MYCPSVIGYFDTVKSSTRVLNACLSLSNEKSISFLFSVEYPWVNSPPFIEINYISFSILILILILISLESVELLTSKNIVLK